MQQKTRTSPDEASIHTAEITAIKITMREIQKRKDMRWVIYTDSLSSMLVIENNRENHPILNWIYDILAEIHNQGKRITLCKVPAHIGIKEMKRQIKQQNKQLICQE